METNPYIPKSAACSVVGFLLIGMCAAASFAFRDDASDRAAAAVIPTSPDSALIGPPTGDSLDGRSSTAGFNGRGSATFIAAGRASFYGYRFEGRPTANGESFDPLGLTAAHPTLPFGTRLRVTNTANDRSVVVRINDRGPYVPGRIIDVSRGAAEQLGMVRSGTSKVMLELMP